MKPTLIHICGTADYKPGDPAPSGYLDWHEWARVQHKAGLKQRVCAMCSCWRFPQELSERVIVTHAIDGKTWQPVRLESPVCLGCATRRAQAQESKEG